VGLKWAEQTAKHLFWFAELVLRFSEEKTTLHSIHSFIYLFLIYVGFIQSKQTRTNFDGLKKHKNIQHLMAFFTNLPFKLIW